jgi:hypothetical protein
MIRVASSIVAATLVSMCASAAIAAGPFGSINVGNWKGGAYTDDKKKSFSHCGVANEDQNGSIVTITKDVRGHFVLSLAYPAWQLMPGRKFPISATFDDRERLRLTGIAATGTTINVALLNNVCGSPNQTGESQPTTGVALGSSGPAAFLGGNAEKPKNESNARSCKRSAFVDHFQKSRLLVVEANAQSFQVDLISPGQLLSAISNCVARVKSGGMANAGVFSDVGQKAPAVTEPDGAKTSATMPLGSGPEQTPPVPAAPQMPAGADIAVTAHISSRESPPSTSAPPENPTASSITEPTSSARPATTVTTARLQGKETENLIEVTGAGLVIDHHGYIATVNHVVSNCAGEIHANLIGDSDMVLQIVSTDETNDLALLRAPGRFNDVGRIREASILVGDPVVAVGSQRTELDLVADKGFVSSLSGLSNDTRFMQISVPARLANTQLANDGGPVLDADGGVVGLIAKKKTSVNFSAVTTSGIPNNTNFVIKSGVIRDFLDNSAVAYQTANRRTELGTEEIVSHAKAYTVFFSCKTR